MPALAVGTSGRRQLAAFVALAAAVLLSAREDESLATLLAALSTVTAVRCKLGERRELSIDNTPQVVVYSALGVAALIASWWTNTGSARVSGPSERANSRLWHRIFLYWP